MNESAETEYVRLHAIHLGSGAKGIARRKALEAMAIELGYVWGGRPSMGRMIIALADHKLRLGVNETPARGDYQSQSGDRVDGGGDL